MEDKTCPVCGETFASEHEATIHCWERHVEPSGRCLCGLEIKMDTAESWTDDMEHHGGIRAHYLNSLMGVQ